MSIDRLSNQLVADNKKPAICKGITELLFNSFYVKSSDSEGDNDSQRSKEQVERCLKFVKSNEAAAAVFYGNLVHVTSIGSVARLASILWTLLVNNMATATLSNFTNDPKLKRLSKYSHSKRQREEVFHMCNTCYRTVVHSYTTSMYIEYTKFVLVEVATIRNSSNIIACIRMSKKYKSKTAFVKVFSLCRIFDNLFHIGFMDFCVQWNSRSDER